LDKLKVVVKTKEQFYDRIYDVLNLEMEVRSEILEFLELRKMLVHLNDRFLLDVFSMLE
jgi:hypothetical protein